MIPRVVVNMAMTADGKITSARREVPAFSSAEDRRRMDLRRAESDAVIVGASSLRFDDPLVGLRHPDAIAYRRDLGKPAHLRRVVLSNSLDLDLQRRFFTAPGEAIIATSRASPTRPPSYNGGALWILGDARVDPQQLLERLAEVGCATVLLEGGAQLNGTFLDADLIDEVYVTIVPTLLGGDRAPGGIGGGGLPMARQRRLHLLSHDVVDGEVFCHYTR